VPLACGKILESLQVKLAEGVSSLPLSNRRKTALNDVRSFEREEQCYALLEAGE